MKEHALVPELRFSEFEESWEKIKIGSITSKVGSGSTPNGGAKVYQESGVPFIRSQNVNHDQLSLNDVVYISEEIDRSMAGSRVSPRDILLNITGASIGRSCVVPDSFKEGNVNQHVCIVRLTEAFDPKFVQSFLSSFEGQKRILRAQAGGGREGLNFESVRGLKFSAPSRGEQQKIADFLSVVDKKISLLKDKHRLLVQYKKGVMQQIFSQQIRFKDDNGQDFPDWEEVKLSKLLFEHKLRNENLEYGKGDVLSVSGDLGVVNQISHLGRSYAGESVHNYHVVQQGDIVYTKSPLKSNPYGIIKANKGNAGIVSTLYAVYSPTERAYSNYLDYYFWLDDNVNRYLRPLVHKGAKNDMKINNQRVLIDPIICPCYEEQVKICDFLDKVDSKIKLLDRQIDSAQTYKKGLLQKMFV